jgi:pimeloyl-ACP methyl ester carboxylesterase
VGLAYERRGAGEPLVLIHGIGSQWQIWRPVLDRLAAHREVIALDLPGFGGSPPLPGEDAVPPERFAAVVADFLDRLELESAHAAGNSLGGGVALELGRLGRARSVTALSPIGFWTAREHGYSRASLRFSRATARLLEPALPVLVATPAGRTALSSQMMARPWQMPADDAVEGGRNLARCPGWQAALDGSHMWRFRNGHELRCPVTIAWGERDRLLIPRQAERARRALPQARHVLLRGCGHVPTHDDPNQVAAVILEASGG